MTPDELIKILKEYDFKKNSVRSFSLKYKITEKTILKYLKEHKIPYNNRKISYEMTRNCLGQYTFKNATAKQSEKMYDSNKITNKSCQNQCQPKSNMKDKDKTNSTPQVGNQSINLSHQNKNNSGRVKNFTEFNKKYEKFFPETS